MMKQSICVYLYVDSIVIESTGSGCCCHTIRLAHHLRILYLFDLKRSTNKDVRCYAIFFYFFRILHCDTIDGKPWTRAREVCKALRYEKKTVNIVKNHYSKESHTQKYQMSSVPTAGTPIYWPKDSQ